MSEYTANDHLHNVTASVQQLTYQAQGVQDITGANVAEYEQISPDAASSVTLSNARKDVPFLALINNLPPVQEGSGTPALDNVRKLTPYTKSVIRNGSDVPPIEVVLPSAMYGGYVDYIGKRIVSDIIRVQVPPNGDWAPLGEQYPGAYIINENGIPLYVKSSADRYAAGENTVVKWGSSASVTAGDVVLFGSGQANGRIYYMPPESAEVTDVDTLKAWLTANPLYIYYRAATPVVVPLDTTIPYVLANNYSVSADSGTLTVKYQGITPDEP